MLDSGRKQPNGQNQLTPIPSFFVKDFKNNVLVLSGYSKSVSNAMVDIKDKALRIYHKTSAAHRNGELSNAEAMKKSHLFRGKVKAKAAADEGGCWLLYLSW